MKVLVLFFLLTISATAQPCITRGDDAAIVLFRTQVFEPNDVIMAITTPLDRCVARTVYHGERYLVMAVWNLGVPVRFVLHRGQSVYGIASASGQTEFRPRLNRSHYRIRPILTNELLSK